MHTSQVASEIFRNSTDYRTAKVIIFLARVLGMYEVRELYTLCSITFHNLYIYLRMFVCLFVCLFAVNAKTTERIDAKRSGITKNYPESVLYGLKSPVLVFLRRYGYISGFSFAADRHFYLSSFHFRLLLRRLTQSASQTHQNYGTN